MVSDDVIEVGDPLVVGLLSGVHPLSLDALLSIGRLRYPSLIWLSGDSAPGEILRRLVPIVD